MTTRDDQDNDKYAENILKIMKRNRNIRTINQKTKELSLGDILESGHKKKVLLRKANAQYAVSGDWRKQWTENDLRKLPLNDIRPKAKKNKKGNIKQGNIKQGGEYGLYTLGKAMGVIGRNGFIKYRQNRLSSWPDLGQMVEPGTTLHMRRNRNSELKNRETIINAIIQFEKEKVAKAKAKNDERKLKLETNAIERENAEKRAEIARAAEDIKRQEQIKAAINARASIRDTKRAASELPRGVDVTNKEKYIRATSAPPGPGFLNSARSWWFGNNTTKIVKSGNPQGPPQKPLPPEPEPVSQTPGTEPGPTPEPEPGPEPVSQTQGPTPGPEPVSQTQGPEPVSQTPGPTPEPEPVSQTPVGPRYSSD